MARCKTIVHFRYKLIPASYTFCRRKEKAARFQAAHLGDERGNKTRPESKYTEYLQSCAVTSRAPSLISKIS